MRKLLLLVAISCSTYLCAQDDKAPSRTEVEGQMRQAIADAKKQREDVRKQILEAKATNQDAASIKQLEDQYAILDKMVSQLETVNPYANAQQKTVNAPKTVEPPFISPFTPITLKTPAVAPKDSFARDRLLWFRGKKIDGNTLITSNGTVVQFDRGTQLLRIQPDKRKDSTYYCLVAALSRLTAWRREFVTEVDRDPNAFFLFPSIQAGYERFNLIRDQYYDLAKNAEDINRPQWRFSAEALLQQLQAYMNTLYPNADAPPLPKKPNLFCDCDFASAMEAFNGAYKKWTRDFDDEEIELSRFIVHLSAEKEALLLRHQAVPETLDGAVLQAGVVLVQRLTSKLISIRQQYQAKNIDVEEALTYAITEANRCILYYGTSPEGLLESKIKELIKERDLAKKLIFSSLFKDVIEEKKAERDFGLVLDYTRYVDHEAAKEMLEENYRGNTQQWIKIFRDFNRFSLLIKMDFEYQTVAKKPEGDDITMIATGTMESDRISLGLGVEDCQVIFFLKDVDNRDRTSNGEKFKIPMHITGGTKDYTKDNKPPFQYTGPPTMQLLFPSFRLNFCGKKSDVKMEDLTYLASDLKQHEHDQPATQYTVDMFGYANKMMVVVKKTEVNVSELIESSIQGLSMKGAGSMSRSTGDPAKDQMNEEYEGDKKRRQLLYKAGNASQSGRAIVDLGVIDPKGSTVIFRKQVDLADPDDPDRERGILLRHGFLSIELVHTPQ